MWLLSTDRAELHHFTSPEAVPGGYAILSHVWDQEEQTFQDVQRVRSEASLLETNPRDLVSHKIRDFCVTAQKYGHLWAWIDTCCIDKTSSAELSEGINSMFRYYSFSQVCYAYLSDVSIEDDADVRARDFESEFSLSRWHFRGWTLQELLAPEVVVFLSQSWDVLGTKAELAPVISQVSRIPVSVLTFERDIADVSIAQRMSWAGHRKTMREEDEAYCLLGIFGISMPTLYGEGRKAFYRLQEELMKKSTDTSLFAWGFYAKKSFFEFIPPPDEESKREYCLSKLHPSTTTYLLAMTPFEFLAYDRIGCKLDPNLTENISASAPYLGGGKSIVAPTLNVWFSSDDHDEPSFAIMPYGVLAHLPVVHLQDYSIAVMRSADHAPVGLILISCAQCPSDKPDRRLYHCGLTRAQRLIPLNVVTSPVPQSPSDLVPRWQDVRLAAWPAFRANDMPTTLPRDLSRTNPDPGVPFRVSNAALRSLQHLHDILLHLSGPTPPSGSWGRAREPMTLVLRARLHRYYICIDMGLCERTEGTAEPWARVRLLGGGTPGERLLGEGVAVHECPANHISQWEAGSMTFFKEVMLHVLSVDLRFAPSFLDSTGGILELQHIGFSWRYQD